MEGFIFSILLLIAAYSSSLKTKYQTLSKIILVILLSFPVAFGGPSFTDHINYANFYNNICNSSFSNFYFLLIGESQVETGFESGYVLLNYLSAFFHFGELGFFSLIAVLTNALMVDVIYRHKYPIFSIILFSTSVVYIQQANLVRQMLSVAIFLYGIRYLENEKPLRFAITCVISALVHTSAFVLLPFSFIPFIKTKNSTIFLYVVLIIVWFLSIFVALGILNLPFSEYLSFFSYYDNKIHGYTSDSLTDIIPIVYIAYSVICFVFLLRVKEKKINIYAIFVILGSILLNFSVQFYYFFRLAFYFLPVALFYLPTMLNALFRKQTEQYSILFVVVLLFYISVYVREYTFNTDVLFFKDMYSLSDFFK